MSIFHLAIPTHDLKLSKNFYTQIFEATVGREYPHYIIFDFFGHQLVCHLAPDEIPKEVKMYPRHFGIVIEDKATFDRIYQHAQDLKAKFFEPLFERYKEKHGWHFSFFLVDPSNNLIEIKYYVSQSDIFH